MLIFDLISKEIILNFESALTQNGRGKRNDAK